MEEFNWKKFNTDIDYAVARYITENPAGIRDIKILSKTSLMEFMIYSLKKTQEQHGTKPNKKM